MHFTASFIVLSVLGLIDSGYLYWKHKTEQPLICPVNHDCSKVTESRWSRIFIVRTEILGMLYYGFLLGSALAATFFYPWMFKIILFATTAGLLFSIFFMYLQKYVIKEYCFYCILSAIISLLLFLNSILLVFRY